MKIFIDSDVILDLLWHRPHWAAGQRLFELGEEKKIELCTSPVVLTDIFYLVSRKSNQLLALSTVRQLSKILQIVRVGETEVDSALSSNFLDFEDALQFFAAARFGCDQFVTRNKKDFISSKLPVLTPEEALARL